MDFRILEKYRDTFIEIVSNPGRLETHQLIIASLVIGYLMATIMSALPHYFRPAIRYMMVIALVLTMRTEIIDTVPDHTDLFAGISDALQEAIR